MNYFNNRNTFPVILVLLVSLSLPGVTLGHHSQAFFSDVFESHQGELVRVVWRNPHILFTLQTTNSEGETDLLEFETNSIYYLERAGVTKDRIQVGDYVTVGGYASTRRGGVYLAAEVLLQDGENVQ